MKMPTVIDLKALPQEIHKRPVHVFGKRLPGILQKLNQRRPADPGEAGHGAERNAFSHHLECFGAFLGGQLVHAAKMAF